MPNPIHTFMIQGASHGAYRCESKEAADAMYEAVITAFRSGNELVQLEGPEGKVSLRVEGIHSFGVFTTYEETPEERKARAIARVEHEFAMEQQYDQPMIQPKLLHANKCVGVARVY